MASATDLISRALRILTVIPIGDPVPSEYTDASLVALNAMMARWEADGITVGWTAVSSPGATLTVPAEAEQAIAYNLAANLASEFGFPITDLIVAMADGEYRRIQRDALLIPINSMGHLPGNNHIWNINSDDFS